MAWTVALVKIRAFGDAPVDRLFIRLRSSVTSRVVNVDTVVGSAAVLPPFQRGQLVPIPRPPGGTELTISAISAGCIQPADGT
jgi:hypothetical protein